MNVKSILTLGAVLLVVLFSACNKPSIIGTDLIEDEQLNIRYTEDIPLEIATATGDSTLTYRLGALLNAHPCGQFKDPIFGIAKAEIYAELGLQNPNSDFTGLLARLVDSLDLILPYNVDFSYGDLSTEQTFEVYEMTENMDIVQDYYSNDVFELDDAMGPIGTYTGITNILDSTIIYDYSFTDTIVEIRYPHIRIPLSEAFKERFVELIAQDTFHVENDSFFQADVLKGLNIRATELTEGMPAFNLQSVRAGLRMVYREDIDEDGTIDPTEKRQYLFRFFAGAIGGINASTVHIEHDYADSPVAPFIDNTNTVDSNLYVQGMQGLLGRISFPDIETFNNVIVNQALLEFDVIELAENDLTKYPPIDQLRVMYKTADGELAIVDDYRNVVNSNLSVTSVVGGDVETDSDGAQSYRLNISNHFQQILDGDVAPEILIQTVYPQAQRAARVVLSKPRFRLTYTNL